MGNRLATALAVGAVVALAGCSSGGADTPPPTSATTSLVLTSANFADGAALPPSAYANGFGGQCSGENRSPQLTWTGAPRGTAAFAATVIDRDAHDFVHALVTNLPASATTIPLGAWDDAGGILGTNSADAVGYFGPCPPSGTHRYVFTLYALDAELSLDAGFSYDDLKAALARHTIAQAQITGTATRN